MSPEGGLELNKMGRGGTKGGSNETHPSNRREGTHLMGIELLPLPTILAGPEGVM